MRINSSRWIAVSEVAGVLGVIATLIFVGTEIQQNTEAIRTATVQAIADQDTTINLAYASDDKIAELVALIWKDPEAYKDESKMSLADNIRLGMILRSALKRVENVFCMCRLAFWSHRPSIELDMVGIRLILRGTIGRMRKMDSIRSL